MMYEFSYSLFITGCLSIIMSLREKLSCIQIYNKYIFVACNKCNMAITMVTKYSSDICNHHCLGM